MLGGGANKFEYTLKKMTDVNKSVLLNSFNTTLFSILYEI